MIRSMLKLFSKYSIIFFETLPPAFHDAHSFSYSGLYNNTAYVVNIYFFILIKA
jgi:hypothetical protein